MPDFHVTFRGLLHAVNLRHGTNGFTSLPTASAGFEPANLGTIGQHATSRPPKPLIFQTYSYIFLEIRITPNSNCGDFLLFPVLVIYLLHNPM